MTVAHASLPNAELHEVKGASAATVGQVPVANGSGSAPFGTITFNSMPTGGVVQVAISTPYTTYSTSTTVLPGDDTIPQSSEGAQIVTVSITPKATTHKLLIEFQFMGQVSGDDAVWAIFQDSTASAIAAGYLNRSAVSNAFAATTWGGHTMTAGTTSSTTFKLRVGPASGGTVAANGGTSGRDFGGVSSCWIKVTEVKA
jgi:hypothetical protein